MKTIDKVLANIKEIYTDRQILTILGITILAIALLVIFRDVIVPLTSLVIFLIGTYLIYTRIIEIINKKDNIKQLPKEFSDKIQQNNEK